MGNKSQSPAERLAAITAGSKSASNTPSGNDKPRVGRTIDIKERRSVVGKYPPAVVFDDRGNILEITISSTLIKRFFLNGEPIVYCPKKEFHCYIIGDVRQPTTLPMLRGLFFETLVIGEGMSSEVYDLPKTANNKPTIDETRIRQQAVKFAHTAESMGMVIKRNPPGKNVQIENKREYESSNKSVAGIKIWIRAIADLITPVDAKGWSRDVAIVDIKLTKDRESTFGEFCWGNPAALDHTQGVLYSHLFGLPFAYFVWDYRKNEPGYKFIPLITLADFKGQEITDQNRALYNLGVTRSKELKIAIEKTIDTILINQVNGWPAKPHADVCKNCPLNPKLGGSCQSYLEIESI